MKVNQKTTSTARWFFEFGERWGSPTERTGAVGLGGTWMGYGVYGSSEGEGGEVGARRLDRSDMMRPM